MYYVYLKMRTKRVKRVFETSSLFSLSSKSKHRHYLLFSFGSASLNLLFLTISLMFHWFKEIKIRERVIYSILFNFISNDYYYYHFVYDCNYDFIHYCQNCLFLWIHISNIVSNLAAILFALFDQNKQSNSTSWFVTDRAFVTQRVSPEHACGLYQTSMEITCVLIFDLIICLFELSCVI